MKTTYACIEHFGFVFRHMLLRYGTARGTLLEKDDCVCESAGCNRTAYATVER